MLTHADVCRRMLTYAHQQAAARRAALGEMETVSRIMQGLRVTKTSGRRGAAAGGGMVTGKGGDVLTPPTDDASLYIGNGCLRPFFPSVRNLSPCDPDHAAGESVCLSRSLSLSVSLARSLSLSLALALSLPPPLISPPHPSLSETVTTPQANRRVSSRRCVWERAMGRARCGSEWSSKRRRRQGRVSHRYVLRLLVYEPLSY